MFIRCINTSWKSFWKSFWRKKIAFFVHLSTLFLLQQYKKNLKSARMELAVTLQVVYCDPQCLFKTEKSFARQSFLIWVHTKSPVMFYARCIRADIQKNKDYSDQIHGQPKRKRHSGIESFFSNLVI